MHFGTSSSSLGPAKNSCLDSLERIDCAWQRQVVIDASSSHGGTWWIQVTGKVCSCDPRCHVDDSRPGLGPHLSSKQEFLSGRQVGVEGLSIWITQKIFPKHKFLRLYSGCWTRILDNEVENEYGSPDSSNVPSPPRFLTLWGAGFTGTVPLPKERCRRRQRREKIDSQGKSPIMSTRKKVYMYFINLFSKKYLPTQIYIVEVVFSLFFSDTIYWVN